MDNVTDMLEYQKSHPWITFRFDTRVLTAMSWMRIGEALSKCDHIAGTPLGPKVADELHRIYMVKGVHATTQIEGNTLTEDEVRQQLEGKLHLPHSQQYLGIEPENVAEACDLVINELIAGKDMTLTPQRIAWFNEMVLKDLDLGEGVDRGKTRQHSVVVGSVYKAPPAEDCDYLLARLCDWLRDFLKGVPDNLHRPMKVLRAVLAHLYIAWIHPFGDGNGRTARLVEFQLLADAGFPTPACHILSNYYNRTRSRYYDVLRETSRNPNYPVERFVNYALDGLVEELREQLKKIREFQLRVAWINYVHEVHGGASDSRVRQRDLLLSLPNTPIPINDLRHLTPQLAEKYAGKHPRTMSRDLNVLEDLNLIQRIKEKGQQITVRPNTGLLVAFLPVQQPY